MMHRFSIRAGTKPTAGLPEIVALITILLALPSCSIENSTPNNAADSQRDEEIRESMQRIQLAAEHYAADHGTDSYPLTIDDDFKSYFPGGQEGSVPAPMGPVNVFTGVNEYPSIGQIKDVHSLRFGPRFALSRGSIQYCPLKNGKGYAIIGGASDGKVMLDEKNPGQVLVFSNFED